MPYLFFKFFLSAGVIVVVSELAKRSTTVAALFISLPLVSILSFIWIYWDTKDVSRVTELSTGTALLVIPSLAFFVILSGAIKFGWNFWLSMVFAIFGTVVAYFIYWKALSYVGFKL